MSSYSELIKNFEKIRAYMREFYIYGFKSRDDYSKKSSRSYDDERRRIESWLGNHMSFVRTPEGKNVFISIDTRSIRHNPFYNAWKAKSFTDGDVTLHFIIFDILHEPSVKCTLAEIMQLIDEKYLSGFENPMMFDESTVRKKLKEYTEAGIIVTDKVGRKVSYSRAEDTDVKDLTEVLHYYSEVAPCGVIGSFILDKEELDTDAFTFKHHYITGAIDSGVLCAIFDAMRRKCVITAKNDNRKTEEPSRIRLIPLRVFISAQNGRQHLLAYCSEYNAIRPFRIDYLSDVRIEEESPRFDELRGQLDIMQRRMWGVNTKRNFFGKEQIEKVSFTVRVEPQEDYIVKRLEREKRIGRIERVDEEHYRFYAEVYDTMEMIPWIRTFICRITELDFSNKSAEKKLKEDLIETYKIYGLSGGK